MNSAHKLKLICFDFDDTLTTQNSWYSLNTALGIFPEEDYAMYMAYKNGEISYVTWTNKIETLYKERGLATKTRITSILEQFELRHDAVATVSALQQRGYEIVIISGSFDITINHAAKLLHVETWRAGTKLKFNPDDTFSHFQSNGEESLTKLRQLTEICAEKNILLSDSICVGDRANDIELFKATGNGICFTDGSHEIRAVAKYTIDNLSDILNIIP